MKRRPFLQSFFALLGIPSAASAAADTLSSPEAVEHIRIFRPWQCTSCLIVQEEPDEFGACAYCRSGVWTDVGEMFADMLNHAQFGDEILRADDPSRILVGFVGLSTDQGRELRRVWRMRIRDLHKWPEHKLAGLFLHIWRDAMKDSERRKQLRAFLADLSDPARLDLWVRFADRVVPDPEFIPHEFPEFDVSDFVILGR